MQDLKITLVQTGIQWEDPAENIGRLEQKLSALNEKPDVIVLPEMFSTGFTMEVEKCAETMDGLSVDFMKRKSNETGCALTGSVLIREDNRFYNRMLWVTPDNKVEMYDKRHLFSMGGEHVMMSAGKSRKVVELNGWRIRLLVCYDLRFPVWCRNIFRDGKYDYDVLICIANWPLIRRDAYLALLPARAIENVSYMVWVNRTGMDGKGIAHSGNSMAIDPKGRMIAQAEADEDCLVTVQLSGEELTGFRDNFRVGPDWEQFSIQA
ncbi:MAG: nitrilase family protein [Bacteroidales bacterium]|nr:nitrilase family protein [Bacteroidales bacterium]